MDIVHGNRANSDVSCFNPLAHKGRGREESRREEKRREEEMECVIRDNEVAQAMLAPSSGKEILDKG
jgi:hypothetical protein